MAAGRFIEAHAPTFSNAKSQAQWRATLGTYASPVIGSLPIKVVDTANVMQVLQPIWPETASKLRGRIERILNWATVQGFRSGDNPARWRGHLDVLLPAKGKVKAEAHHPALAYEALPAFMAALAEKDYVSARALEFTILTAARTGEVIGARWDEIDLKAKLWTVPAGRMKAKKEHRVPLSDRAVRLLANLPVTGDHVFTNGGGRPLSNQAMSELVKGMKLPSTTPGKLATVHGMRSTFSDWARDRTHAQRDVVEAALAHVIESKAEAAYRRGDALEKRRCLMSDWSNFATGTFAAGEVVALRA
jgi:integrase